jgi:ribosomal 50S subunit-recycling heat shock protein
MRIDQLLHWLCLAKSRSQAARGCQEGRVRVNGELVRPAREVRLQDEITLRGLVGERARVVRVDRLPERQQGRKDAPGFYTLVREERIDSDAEPGPAGGGASEA